MSVCPSFRPSVCLLRSGIVSKQLNIPSYFLHSSFLSRPTKHLCEIQTRSLVTPTGRWIHVGYINVANFHYYYKWHWRHRQLDLELERWTWAWTWTCTLNLNLPCASQLCYQSADGGGGLSCCYFVCAQLTRDLLAIVKFLVRDCHGTKVTMMAWTIY